jgi:hypothetical protein
MTEVDICEQLRNFADVTFGAGVCVEAAAKIECLVVENERLRAQVFGQGARLDQLHSIVGAAMAEPLTTFADIKKEIIPRTSLTPEFLERNKQ